MLILVFVFSSYQNIVIESRLKGYNVK